jgi:hypothetical protein
VLFGDASVYKTPEAAFDSHEHMRNGTVLLIFPIFSET